jgi:hypothetical protein
MANGIVNFLEFGILLRIDMFSLVLLELNFQYFRDGNSWLSVRNRKQQ